MLLAYTMGMKIIVHMLSANSNSKTVQI